MPRGKSTKLDEDFRLDKTEPDMSPSPADASPDQGFVTNGFTSAVSVELGGT
ncbi:MAG TPA: hypothetical protein VL793_12220 [Patescibacteria group bacterium]|nr:hypothetical protein [Patescibacteria group bacterium]